MGRRLNTENEGGLDSATALDPNTVVGEVRAVARCCLIESVAMKYRARPRVEVSAVGGRNFLGSGRGLIRHVV